MVDFVCIGDATQDNFFFVSDASVHCDLNNANCELTLRYGDKIPVERIGQSLGGNAANVSVGLSRLGIATNLVTIFGDDERGVWIKKQLMQNNVNLDQSFIEPKRESNLSSIIVFKQERTILSFHSHGGKDIENIPPAKWLYLTSSPGPNSVGLFEKVLAFKNDYPEAKLIYNPYPVDLKNGKDFLQEIVLKSEILVVNKQEQETLGMFSPQMTVVTDGENGAAVFENGKKVASQPSVASEVLEVTGAGDAFSSGFLGALYYNKDVETALSWGLKNSASVISKIGAIEGLLTKTDLDAGKS